MRFHSYEMWINGTDKFSKQDMRDAVSKANTKFQDGDMLYLIQLEILEERFLWLSCDYENMKKYSRSVLNHDYLKWNQIHAEKNKWNCGSKYLRYMTRKNKSFILAM